MHSRVSGDYVLYVRLHPDSDGDPGLSGWAYICTPRGEIIELHLYGTMRSDLNRVTDGEPISLDMQYWRVLTAVFVTDNRPYLSFVGQWQKPNLVLK